MLVSMRPEGSNVMIQLHIQFYGFPLIKLEPEGKREILQAGPCPVVVLPLGDMANGANALGAATLFLRCL